MSYIRTLMVTQNGLCNPLIYVGLYIQNKIYLIYYRDWCLVQDCVISSALAMDVLLHCAQCIKFLVRYFCQIPKRVTPQCMLASALRYTRITCVIWGPKVKGGFWQYATRHQVTLISKFYIISIHIINLQWPSIHLRFYNGGSYLVVLIQEFSLKILSADVGYFTQAIFC